MVWPIIERSGLLGAALLALTIMVATLHSPRLVSSSN